ncbi:MAG: helix-turn-helix domain-containing protein [Bryobacteraceae bacterium]
MPKPTFGATLRNLRESRGLSLRKLAGLANISPTYLVQLERDQNTPSEDVVFALANALDCDEDEMLAVTGRIAKDLLDMIRNDPRRVAGLLLAIQNLPPKEIESLARSAERRKRKLGLE